MNGQSSEPSSRRQFLGLMHACRKCVDMVGTFVAVMGRGGAQRAVSSPKDTGLIKSEASANGLPAFEAWLHAYRKRLEEVCGVADPIAVSAGRTNCLPSGREHLSEVSH